MAAELKLNQPWMVAVWPGMGHVAISTGYYLMTKLEMHILTEFPAQELFDVEHVEVKDGLISTGRLPRSRFFVWTDPKGRRDVVLFIGDAQPSKGRYAFCHRLIEFAKKIGVNRVYTFAAMATEMEHQAESRVFAAATDQETLRRVQAGGSSHSGRRSHRRAERDSTRRGGGARPAGRMSPGRNAPHFRAAPVPQSVAGCAHCVPCHCPDRDRPDRAFDPGERDE